MGTLFSDGKDANSMNMGSEDTAYSLLEDILVLKEDIAGLKSNLIGARSMLNEAAKQFRLLGDSGHAVMCERHIASINSAIGE